MSAQSRIFYREANSLLITAANALDESISYMRDLPQAADTVEAIDLATQALDLAQGAETALAGIRLDSNDERH